MRPMTDDYNNREALTRRAGVLFSEHQQAVFRRTDRLFAGLLVFQWLAGIATAIWVSPETWAGTSSQTHIHVWAALFLGGAIISFPVVLALMRPGRVLTRHVIGVAQMLMGALLIHLTGGRIETHFHIFGSLAFLAFYRDWRVLLTSSVVVAVDHLVRGLLWPQSVYGVVSGSEWRWLEHAGWVVFEDLFLIYSCRQSLSAMRAIAERQAQLEATNTSIEAKVTVRTAELRASEARKAAILESALDCVITMDHEGRVVEFNPAAAKVFGYSHGDVLGRELAGLIIPPALRERHRRGLAHYLATGEGPLLCKLIETTALRSDGTEFPVEVTVSLVRQEGHPMFTAILRDITERKKVEADQRRAWEAAEAANRAKSEFLASMSHEIRTPMNGVLGMLGLLLDTELTDRQRDMGELARSSAENLLTILNDILDFSKIEAGRLDIEPVPFDLRQTVEEVAAVVAVQAQKKGLDVIVRYPPDAPCQVVGDAGRIRQVLTNLAGNAVKFTDKGHVLIDLEEEAASDGTARFHVSVQDTGIGIPADKLGSVFGRFSQADTSTTRRYGGTGLGLAISKQLVELMGGTISASSESGKGSAFRFTLPLPLDRQAPAGPPPKTDLAGVRVLIVDDNEVNRRILHELITAWGMRNGSYGSGEQALALLRSAQASGDPYQVALLDHHMPGMDGEQLARAIKADPALRDTVLVMLSSVGGSEDPASQGVFDAYLVKPVRPSQLQDVLATVWARAPGRAVTAAAPEARRVEPRAGREKRPPRHARVLVVDDHTVNQKVARMMLEQLGCRVDLAADGREAVEMVELLPYDVVFMDCEMPVLDGFAATAEIRRPEGTGRRVPIVAMTARAFQGDRERCLQAGMDDYISKPVKTESLERVLDRWAPAGADQPPALDPAVLAGLKGMAEATDPALLGQIVESFLSDSRTGLATLRQAAAGDAEGLRKIAHGLKGMSASVGAEGMRALCQELEALGASGTVEGALELVDRLENEFQRAEAELDVALPEGAVP